MAAVLNKLVLKVLEAMVGESIPENVGGCDHIIDELEKRLPEKWDEPFSFGGKESEDRHRKLAAWIKSRHSTTKIRLKVLAEFLEFAHRLCKKQPEVATPFSELVKAVQQSEHVTHAQVASALRAVGAPVASDGTTENGVRPVRPNIFLLLASLETPVAEETQKLGDAIATEVGRQLAQTPYRLLHTGRVECWANLACQEFSRNIGDAAAVKERLRTYFAEKIVKEKMTWRSTYKGMGEVIVAGRTPEDRRLEMLKLSDVVLSMAGHYGSDWTIAEACKLDVPIVAIPTVGGTAERLHASQLNQLGARDRELREMMHHIGRDDNSPAEIAQAAIDLIALHLRRGAASA